MTHGRGTQDLMEAVEEPVPAVSVVIPTRNRAAMLTEALDSVRCQTVQPLEVIVVDDASDDETPTIVNRFGPRCRYLRNPNRLGPAASRNRGCALARGSLIGFLDSDDLWKPGKLEAQLRRLKQVPGCGLVYTDRIWVNTSDGRVSFPPLSDLGPLPEGWILNELLLDWPIALPSVLLPAAVFHEMGGFDEELVTAEDVNLWARIALRYPVAAVPEPLVVIRLHEDNMTRTVSERETGFLRHIEKIERLAPSDYPRRAWLFKEARSRWHWRNTVWAATAGNYRAARSHARACLACPGRRVRAALALALLGLPTGALQALDRGYRAKSSQLHYSLLGRLARAIRRT